MSKRNLVKLGLPTSKGFWLGLFVSTLQGISAVALLATSAWLISRAAEMPPVLYLQLAVVGVRGFALGRAFFRYVERLLLHDAAFRQLAMLRPRVFKSLIPFAPAGFASFRSGEMLSRITSDVDEMQFLPLRVVSPLVQSAIVSILSVVGLAILVPNAAALLGATCLIAFFVAIPISGLIARKTDANNASQRAALSVETLKLFESLDELRAFGWSQSQLQRIEFAESQLAGSAKKSAWSQGMQQASFALLSVIATVGSAFFAADAFSAGRIAGVWLAVVTLLPLAVFDVLQVVQPMASAWQRYLVAAERVAEVLEAKTPDHLRSEELDRNQSIAPFETLQLNQASIGYGGAAVVSGLSLDLRAGEVLALTGASGAGKSSVALAIAGFLALESGSYSYNGADATKISAESLRTKICYLQQHPTVFAGDVIANLKVAKPDASDNEMIEVLSRVKLWSMLEAREGLQTDLGELGRAISGGEAARLALARALLLDFDVLIFDEPTANLDFENGQSLTKEIISLTKSRPHRAAIIISHDTDVAALADRTQRIG
ncbi:MAG: hypothetical protein RL196_1094 [Actinomycetota bacterium]|jgi:ATP-binding cassette subfamily C protein CydC